MADKLVHQKHERVHDACDVHEFFEHLRLATDDKSLSTMVRPRFPLTLGSMQCHQDREMVTMTGWRRFRSGNDRNYGKGVGDAVSVDIIGTDDANNVYTTAFKGKCQDVDGNTVYVFPLNYKTNTGLYSVWVNDCAGRLITGDTFGGHAQDPQQVASAVSCILQSTAFNLGKEFQKESFDDQRVDMLLYVFKKMSIFARRLAQFEKTVYGMFVTLSHIPTPVDVLPSLIFSKLFSVDVPNTVRVSWMHNIISRNKKHHTNFRSLPTGIITCMFIIPIVLFPVLRFFDASTFTEIKYILASKYNSVIQQLVREHSTTENGLSDMDIIRVLSEHVEHFDPILDPVMTTKLCEYTPLWTATTTSTDPEHINDIVRHVVTTLRPLTSVSTDMSPMTVCGKHVVKTAFLTTVTQDGISTYWPPDVINWSAIRFEPMSVTVRCKFVALPPQSFETGDTRGLMGCANARITTGEEVLKSNGFSTAGKAFVNGKYVDIMGIDTGKSFVIESYKNHLSTTMSFVVYQESRVVHSYSSDTPLTIAFKNCRVEIEQLDHVSGVHILNLENELNRIKLSI